MYGDRKTFTKSTDFQETASIGTVPGMLTYKDQLPQHVNDILKEIGGAQ
jgi:hypothetical protein